MTYNEIKFTGFYRTTNSFYILPNLWVYWSDNAMPPKSEFNTVRLYQLNIGFLDLVGSILYAKAINL